jgi:hypothetical protein
MAKADSFTRLSKKALGYVVMTHVTGDLIDANNERLGGTLFVSPALWMSEDCP